MLPSENPQKSKDHSMLKKLSRIVLPDSMVKWISQLHALWYRVSGGRIGGRVLDAPVLLLTTIGRKTGKQRTTPLLYLQDGDDLVVVGSNSGKDKAPLWWSNLLNEPFAQVNVNGQVRDVIAHQAEGAERERLWRLLLKMYATYAEYQTRTAREIPVMVLRPADQVQQKRSA
jgi:deazaflavin-dependent oxidoreductase (nitroreductase family)